jgi:hypothetical protein
VLIGILSAIGITSLVGQIIYTASFTRLLHDAGIEYAAPAESWLHVTIPPEDDYMDYDLVVENDRNDFEVRYRIHRQSAQSKQTPASVEVARLVASIASNEPETEIRITIPPDGLLKEAFNADRGVIGYFTPKPDFSEKTFGALVSLYQSSESAIDIVLLYNDPEFDPLGMYRSIRFRE